MSASAKLADFVCIDKYKLSNTSTIKFINFNLENNLKLNRRDGLLETFVSKKYYITNHYMYT